MTEPFTAIGAEELGGPLQSKSKCPNCGKPHTVKYADEIKNGRKIPSKMLATVKCINGSSYLVGLGGLEIK